VLCQQSRKRLRGKLAALVDVEYAGLPPSGCPTEALNVAVNGCRLYSLSPICGVVLAPVSLKTTPPWSPVLLFGDTLIKGNG
jgi:hypothetical protein